MALEPVLDRRRVAAARQPDRILQGDRSVDGQAAAGVVPGVVDRRRDRGVPRRRRGGGRAARRRRSTRSRTSSTSTRRASRRPPTRWSNAPRARPACRRAPRLSNVELPRTTGQLRQGAAAARERSWTLATIDTKANLRSYYGPLGGAVVVFGPNNFPFAFNSVAGGDFVAAIAAGNPVIGKANTGHPGTSRLLAELALEAARAAGLPPGWCRSSTGRRPTSASRWCPTRASPPPASPAARAPGLKLKEAADRAGKPIYLEMSSTNPVFVLPRALDERGAAIAKELFDSCAMGAGQFCTRPGLTIVPKGRQAAPASSPSWPRCSRRARRARCSGRRARPRSRRR